MVLVAVSAVSQAAHCWYAPETGWAATVHWCFWLGFCSPALERRRKGDAHCLPDQCGNMGVRQAFLTKICVRDQGREMVELWSAEVTYIHLRSVDKSNIFVFSLPL